MSEVKNIEISTKWYLAIQYVVQNVSLYLVEEYLSLPNYFDQKGIKCTNLFKFIKYYLPV